jgi:hypothetical protein
VNEKKIEHRTGFVRSALPNGRLNFFCYYGEELFLEPPVFSTFVSSCF